MPRILEGLAVVGRLRTNMAHVRQSRPNVAHVRQSRPNMAHVRQSRPDSGLGLQLNVLKTIQVVPSALGSGRGGGGLGKADDPGR